MNRRNFILEQIYSKEYNISYNLNGGTISTPNPSSYSLRTSEFSLNAPARQGYTFLGWTMNNSDEYVTDSNFGSYGDREYTAHWNMNVTSEDVSNNISNLTIIASDDTNNDGAVDNYQISFKASSSYERINLPLKNLIVGQKYQLVFTESNNATNGTMSGYYPAMYGSYVDSTKNNSTGGSTKEIARTQGGLIAEWIGAEGGHLSVIDGKSLNGPRNITINFTASATTMYWIWDYGLIADGVIYTFNLTNITLKPVVPSINFNSLTLQDDTQYRATFKINNSTSNSLNFTFDGENGTEFLYYSITGLTIGSTYTISLNHKFSGAFINGNGGTYEYGCGILSDLSTAVLTGKMANISSKWLSNLWTMNVVSNSTEQITLTFTADKETAYWIWNMANVQDTTIATIDLQLTNFKAKHKNGGEIVYNIN